MPLSTQVTPSCSLKWRAPYARATRLGTQAGGPVPDTCRHLVCKADCDRRQREPDGGGQCLSDLVGVEIHWLSFAIGRMLICLEMCGANSPKPFTQVIIRCSLRSKS